MSGAILRVSLRQDGPIALDVEFQCGAQELVALVGPSGAGKTTILRAIAGLYRPRHGTVCLGEAVWFDGARKISLGPQARRVGFVFQQFALFPHLSALDNVALAADGPDPRVVARDWLARMHLEGLEARLPARLSGGQQQRVALARALIRDPNVLLLDEPFASVDRLVRGRLIGELQELRATLKSPTILVTHDLDEAVRLADRMAVIDGGRIVDIGPPRRVVEQPATPEVARLLGL